MSADTLRRLSTLSRWRTFQEAQAQLVHQQAAAHHRQCEQAHASAVSDALALQGARRALLEQPALDLVRIEWSAAMEAAAWAVESDAAHTRDSAMAARDQACTAHLGARTQLKVADAAQQRARDAAHRAQEMREFDQLSDLIAGGRR